jgi:hypothetical protein
MKYRKASKQTLLAEALTAQFPSCQAITARRAARDIDLAMNELLKSTRSLKVRKARATKGSPAGALDHKFVRRRPSSPSTALRRLAAVAGNHRGPHDDNFRWVRAWQEAPTEAIGYLIDAAGGHAAFNRLPTCRFERPAKERELTPEEVAAFVNAKAISRKIRTIPLSFDVPTPSAITPLFPAALKAAAHRHPTWPRDFAAGTILRALAELSGGPVRQPQAMKIKDPKRGDARKGAATEFLLFVDNFYRAKFFARLVKSGAGMARVLRIAR